MTLSTYRYKSQRIGPLTDPAAHGAPKAPAFHVEAPSLPGHTFTDKSPVPTGHRCMARHIAARRGDVPRHDGYIARGGDRSSVICGWIGHDHAVRNGGGQ